MNPMEKVGRFKISSPVFAGLFYSLFMLFLMMLLISLILTFTQMNEQTVSSMVYAVHGVAVLIGGYVTGKRAGQKGWYLGTIFGLIYCLTVILIAFLGFDSFDQKHSLVLLLISILLGAFGGILGVNRK